jgi:hypothetical protein
MSSMRTKLGANLGWGFDNAVDPAISALELLAPLAKAIPILGSTVEGSVEAVKMTLTHVKVI